MNTVIKIAGFSSELNHKIAGNSLAGAGLICFSILAFQSYDGFAQSQTAINLPPRDEPMITRGWDPFGSNAGVKVGSGRWGLFMEPSRLVLGIPQLVNRGFEVARYRTDG